MDYGECLFEARLVDRQIPLTPSGGPRMPINLSGSTGDASLRRG
jgi:hypothetical protein